MRRVSTTSTATRQPSSPARSIPTTLSALRPVIAVTCSTALLAASDADISEVLALEPFHFGALSGRGLVKIGQGKYLEARNAFNAALEVNPGMDSVRDNLRLLDEYLQNSAI